MFYRGGVFHYWYIMRSKDFLKKYKLCMLIRKLRLASLPLVLAMTGRTQEVEEGTLNTVEDFVETVEERYWTTLKTYGQ